jgi:hypothetical protein
MVQRYHIFAVSSEDDLVLTEWHGGRWLLPFCDVEPSARPTCAIQQAAQRLGLTGFVADLPHSRVANDFATTDFLAVWACTDRSVACIPSTTTWSPTSRLQTDLALLDRQSALLSAYRASQLNPRDWPVTRAVATLDEIKVWVTDAVHRTLATDAEILGFEQYRVSARRTVTRFVMSGKTSVFFRANSEPPFTEARLSGFLASLPSGPAAPRTLAFDERRGWWLCASATGDPFGENADFDAHVHVVRHLARLQIALASQLSELQRLGLPLVSWNAVRELIADLLTDFERRLQPADGFPRHAIDRCRQAIQRVSVALDGQDFPVTWIDTDLFYGNVFTHGDRIELVDLEKSSIGAPHLALETFLSNLTRVRPAIAEWQSGLRARYHDEWAGLVTGEARRLMEETGPLAARMLRLSLRAQLTSDKIARGELQADMVALRDRAARQLCAFVMRQSAAASPHPACA